MISMNNIKIIMGLIEKEIQDMKCHQKMREENFAKFFQNFNLIGFLLLKIKISAHDFV